MSTRERGGGGGGQASHQLVRSYVEPSNRADESLQSNAPAYDEKMGLVCEQQPRSGDSHRQDKGLPQPARHTCQVGPNFVTLFSTSFRFFPVFPWTCGRAPWIPGVQTLKMGERWGRW